MKGQFSIALATVLSVSSHIAAWANNGLRTYQQSQWEEAVQTSKDEQKNMLILFGAKWCTPCVWMQSYTFKDPSLIEYLNRRYVVVYVDIDQWEGFRLKEEYGVKVLPTMVIRSPEGKVRARIEESLGPEMLLELCRRHDVVQPRGGDKANSSKTSSSSALSSLPTDPPVPSAQKHAKRGTSSAGMSTARYTLQFGAFSRPDNARSFAEEIVMQANFNVVIVETKGIYRVLGGEFQTKAEALQARADLKLKGIPSVIVKL